MKLLASYVIFIVVLVFLLKKEGLPRLRTALYVPLCWMVISFSRSLSQWLQFRGSFDRFEADREGSPLDAAFFLVLILLGLSILYQRRADIAAIVKSNKALFMFYGFALLSLMWADYPLVAFKRWTKWFGSLIMVLVILSEEDPPEATKSLVKRCAYALIPLSILFIKFVPSMGRVYTRSGVADYHGVATQKNEYGILLLICGIYFAWELITMWRRRDLAAWRRIGYVDLFFLAVIFWQLVFIDSKTPILCLLLAIGVIFFIGHPYFKGSPQRARNTVVAIVIVIIVLQLSVDIKSTIISSAGRNPTLTDRTMIWAEILQLPLNPWIGAGWDNFWFEERVAPLWEKWVWRPRSAHNGYLETYLYLGWSGIVLLFLVLLSGFRKSTDLFSSDIEAGSLALAFFFAFLFQNYAESSFHRLSPMWFFFLLLSLVRMPRGLRGGEPESP